MGSDSWKFQIGAGWRGQSLRFPAHTFNRVPFPDMSQSVSDDLSGALIQGLYGDLGHHNSPTGSLSPGNEVEHEIESLAQVAPHQANETVLFHMGPTSTSVV